MKKFNSLKAMFTYMVAAFVGMVVFASCGPDDITGHDDANQSKGKIVVKEDTTKKPEPVLTDTIYAYYRGDSLIIRYDSLRNDTIFKSDSTSIKFSANVKRNDDERQTTSARLEYPNMDFTFNAAQNKQNGKMEFFGTQTGSDEDGQEYTVTLNSGKTSFHGLNNVHFILKGTELVRFDNEKLTPKSTESVRVNSTMKWNLTVGIENVPGFDKELVVKANETSHERYILKNAPELIKRDDWKVWKETGNWSTVWHFECNEYWNNDSVAPKSKLTTLNGTYSRKDLDDKTVSNLVDYTHPAGSLVWGDYAEITSKDAGVKLFEKKGTKKAYATNGFDADKFDTEFTVTMQKADVMFCDSLFHVESDEATLTNQRNIFVDEDSDRDGYQMVRFTDTEVAKWNGEYDVTLDESCKLYLKLKEPELIGFLFDQSVKHSTNEVKVVTIATPQFDNGAEGDTLHFVLTEPETFKCIDNFSFEKVQNVSEVSGAMEKDGELDSTKVTKEVKNGKYTGTYTYYKYTQKYRHSITNDGETKWQHWVSTWYDRFSFDVSSYKNGADKYDVVKSFSASVEKDANHLTQSTSLSTEDLEVWLYAINGTFKLDNVERKDIGTGTITKTIIGTNHWDESTKGQEHTAIYSKRWCKYIRYKADGTVTEQLYEAVFNNLTGGSEHRVTAEKPVYTSGTVVPLAPSSEARTDDFCSFDAIKYSFEKDAFYEGAAESKKDFANFTVSENAYFEVEGNRVYFENPEHSISHTDSELKQVSETDEVTTYERSTNWTFTFGGAQLTATSKGIVDILKAQDTPDFNYAIEGIIESVSRPSTRTAVPVTAYTGLFLLDGNKCQPYGIYKDAKGEITFVLGDVVDRFEDMNGACWEKNQNKVVATKCVSADGFVTWYRADGSVCDAAKHSSLQEVGFNDRGNDCLNHTGNFKPQHTKKNGVEVVTWSGIPESVASYTYKGWNVQ